MVSIGDRIMRAIITNDRISTENHILIGDSHTKHHKENDNIQDRTIMQIKMLNVIDVRDPDTSGDIVQRGDTRTKSHRTDMKRTGMDKPHPIYP